MTRVVTFLLLAAMSLSGASSSDWESLRALQQGAPVGIVRKGGETVNGKFTGFTADAISVQTKKQAVSVPRAEVARVRRNSKGRGKWIGLGIGAGAGAGAGAALGTRLANESAGDINLKGVSTAVVAAAGALIGLGIGAALDSRHSTIYVAP